MDVEVVVVEDCSKYKSEDLIAEYAKKSNLTIKYVENEKNLGAGESRNRGILEATKEYITFLDSDDEFSDDYFECIKEIVGQKYDIIVYDAVRLFQNARKQMMSMFFSSKIQEGPIDPKPTLVYIKGCTCGKIYKTDIVKQNYVKFGTIPRNEDLVFSKTAISYAKKVFYLKRALYIYNDNESSLMNDSSLNNPNNALTAYRLVCENLRDRGYEPELNSIFFIEILYSVISTLIQWKYSSEEVEENYKKYRKLYNKKDKYRNFYSLKYKIPFILFEFKLFRLYNSLRNLYKKFR
jgi:glycosyltransferase involved in cell wall biosynthesis